MNILRYFLCVFVIMVSGKPMAEAQDVYEARLAVADSVSVNAGTSMPGIIERLKPSVSGVSVDAPDALLMRLVPPVMDSDVSAVGDADDVVEDQEAEKILRTKSGKIVGYRVQVYADNNVRSAKAEARQRERAVGQAFPSYGTYVSYASPYWRLRVGDFRSQYDAEKAAAEIRKAFPRYAREVRVVRDRINAR